MATNDTQGALKNIQKELENAMQSIAQFVGKGVDDITGSINDIFQTSGDDLTSAGDSVKQNLGDLADSTSNYFAAVADVLTSRWQGLKTMETIRKGVAQVEDATGLDLSAAFAKFKDTVKQNQPSFSDEVKMAQTYQEVKQAFSSFADMVNGAKDVLVGAIDEAQKNAKKQQS